MYHRIFSSLDVWDTNLSAQLGGASSPGGDASPRRHCQLGVRCPKLAILELVISMYLLVKASSLD